MDDFRIRKEDYYQENGGVIFPNPNAPTGIYEGLEFVEDIIAHNQMCIRDSCRRKYGFMIRTLHWMGKKTVCISIAGSFPKQVNI